ncbi:hypothetical protein NHX12_008830 [Muraenolepis orangiensis]|uniref:A20-type domain-containing protein n=1 Tax=Muraenolepis orangiensis TaxID=630683 RepID=A0A9Q0DAD9_9TELE|nr:hypothetical protein NHX12_000081 [Muraenolepis orangiensis]KAJ3590882.1 hypothetical protein NHX12_008830 [Muraenolepis orangiensis]
MTSQRFERSGIHLDQSELLCPKGCGFYGNGAWRGLCSKCWHMLQKEEEAAYASVHQKVQPQPMPVGKLEERKTKEKSTKVNSVITKLFSTSTKTPPKKVTFQWSPVQVPQGVTMLPGREIFKQCRAFTESMVYKRDFYQNLSEYLHTQFKEKLDGQSLNMSSEDFELHMSGQASSPVRPLASGGASAATLQQVQSGLDLLTGLGVRQEQVMKESRRLESDLIDWSEGMEHKTRGPAAAVSAAPSAIDADNVENDLQPPPLQPQLFAG